MEFFVFKLLKKHRQGNNDSNSILSEILIIILTEQSYNFLVLVIHAYVCVFIYISICPLMNNYDVILEKTPVTYKKK